MNNLTVILKVHGIICFTLAISHCFFGRELKWKEDTARLSPVNHDIFHVHTLFIVLVLSMMGHLTLFATFTLLERTALGYYLALYLCIFWLVRLYAQWFVFRRSLWQGKRKETIAHYMFTVIWAYFVYVGLVLLVFQW